MINSFETLNQENQSDDSSPYAILASKTGSVPEGSENAEKVIGILRCIEPFKIIQPASDTSRPSAATNYPATAATTPTGASMISWR